MKKLYYALMFLFILGFSNYAEVHAQKTEVKEKSAIFYEIIGKGLEKPSYLFGTVHIVCPKDMISMKKFDTYLNKSEQLVMELDLDDQDELRAFPTLTKLPEGKTLKDYLTKDQYAKIDEMTREILSTPLDNLKTSHPIVFQSMLYSSQKVIGCSPAGSYELTFMQYAISKGKPIQGLETVAMQMESLNKTPIKEQAEDIHKIALDTNKFFTNFAKLIEVYKTQNSDDLFAFTKSQFENRPGFQETMLDDRNINWIPKIEKAIKEKPSFVAVGAAHLGGEKGVLNLLRAKGYSLKPVRF